MATKTNKTVKPVTKTRKLIATINYDETGPYLEIGERSWEIGEMANNVITKRIGEDRFEYLVGENPAGEWWQRVVYDLHLKLMERYGVTHVLDTESELGDGERAVAISTWQRHNQKLARENLERETEEGLPNE